MALARRPTGSRLSATRLSPRRRVAPHRTRPDSYARLVEGTMIRRWSQQASLLVTLTILAACGTPVTTVGQPGVPPTATPTAHTVVATVAHLPPPTRATLVDQGVVTTGESPGISNARQ